MPFGFSAYRRVSPAELILQYSPTTPPSGVLPIFAEARSLVLENLAAGPVELYINGLKIPLTPSKSH